jgi:hypothetical protein
MKRGKYTVDFGIFFSSPGQKGQVRYCNHLATIIVCKFSHCRLVLTNHFTKWNQTWENATYVVLNNLYDFCSIWKLKMTARSNPHLLIIQFVFFS